MKNADNVELVWSATDVKLSVCTVIHSDTSIAITEQTVYHEIWLLHKSKSIFLCYCSNDKTVIVWISDYKRLRLIHEADLISGAWDRWQIFSVMKIMVIFTSLPVSRFYTKLFNI